jgi:hypothetical protein
MADVDDINDAIADNASGPKRMRVGAEEVEQHSVKDQIAARDDLAARQAATRPGFGFRFQQIKPVYR